MQKDYTTAHLFGENKMVKWSNQTVRAKTQSFQSFFKKNRCNNQYIKLLWPAEQKKRLFIEFENSIKIIKN